MATNLEFIRKDEITSAVTSHNVDNIFSDTYDVYQIIIENVTYPTAATWLNLRFLDSSGSVISTANYDFSLLNAYSSGSFGQYRGTNQTGLTYGGNYSSSKEKGNAERITVYNPYNSNSYTYTNHQGAQWATNLYANRKLGALKTQSTVRGINLYTGSTTTFDGGVIKVYGIK